MKINRRNFLKLSSLVSLATPWIGASNPIGQSYKTSPEKPNILIVIFDALSALDVSLYGYHRATMPNLARFAERATVYHNHYSAGNFTTAGTASILTGTYPWTHRAIHIFGTVLDAFKSRNAYSAFGQYGYTRVGFSHNILVNVLLHQFIDQIDEYTPPHDVALVDFDISDDLFASDFGIAYQSELRYFMNPTPPSNSIYLHRIHSALRALIGKIMGDRLKKSFPRCIPGNQDMFTPLEDTVDWIMKKLLQWPQPFISYLHMMPPHDPYCPRADFVDIFWDDWKPIEKPDHFFSKHNEDPDLINIKRVFYDEYIAYVDVEFGRLHDFMVENGLYENTIVIFSSDHGEMFERRIWGHFGPTLFEPVIRVPLLISLPQQTTRHDVHIPTNSVDILPTLLHLIKHPIPDWTEGLILPPFTNESLASERSLFAIEARSNPKTGPLRKATVAMIKGRYKLIHYRGYEGFDDQYELYDLEEDPEELQDLYAIREEIAAVMRQELLAAIEEKDHPFSILEQE
jgi:arylsulfatase A-like enzyme